MCTDGSDTSVLRQQALEDSSHVGRPVAVCNEDTISTCGSHQKLL